eukprot:gene13948-50289_t
MGRRAPPRPPSPDGGWAAATDDAARALQAATIVALRRAAEAISPQPSPDMRQLAYELDFSADDMRQVAEEMASLSLQSAAGLSTTSRRRSSGAFPTTGSRRSSRRVSGERSPTREHGARRTMTYAGVPATQSII